MEDPGSTEVDVEPLYNSVLGKAASKYKRYKEHRDDIEEVRVSL